MAEIVRYVDTDVVGGAGDGSSWANAHPTLADWETDNQQDLTDSSGDWMHAYVRGAANDTTQVTIDGWTTNEGCYIHIEGSSDSTGKHSGVWNTSTYILENNDVSAYTWAVNVAEDYVRIIGIQILITPNATSDNWGIYQSNAGLCIFSNLIVRQVGTATVGVTGIYVSAGSTRIVNAIVYGIRLTSAAGIHNYGGTAVNIYSSLIEDCDYGLLTYSTNATNLYNCVIFNNTDDFVKWNTGTIVCDYCASDDANADTYTNGIDFTSEATDWAAIFTDYANGDFRLKNYTGARCLIDKGASQSYGNPDIRGMARVTWDIGPFEAAPLSISASECVGSLGRLA